MYFCVPISPQLINTGKKGRKIIWFNYGQIIISKLDSR